MYIVYYIYYERSYSNSYVKFLQSAGAQVIPIMAFWTENEIATILGKLQLVIIIQLTCNFLAIKN